MEGIVPLLSEPGVAPTLDRSTTVCAADIDCRAIVADKAGLANGLMINTRIAQKIYRRSGVWFLLGRGRNRSG